MKIKATSNSIFTINSSLKEISFTENIILKKPTKWLYPFYRYSLGKFETENDDKIDEITLEYKPSTIHRLKYLYHIKRIGGGLKFTHMGYTKLNFWQHLCVMFSNRLLPWISKFKNIMKMLTIITAITTCYIGYKQIELSNKVQKIEIINTKK